MESEIEQTDTGQFESVLRAAREAQKSGDFATATKGYHKILTEASGTDIAWDAGAFQSQMRVDNDPNYVSLIAGIILLVGAAVLMIMAPIAFHFPHGNCRAFFENYWGWILIAAVILIFTMILAQKIDNPLLKLPESRQNFILAFGSIFLIMFAIGLSVFLNPAHRMFVYEILFILTVCILPAATYYLFLKSRRPSILNEFIGNLSRLGLLSRRPLYALPVDTVDASGNAVTVTYDRDGKQSQPDDFNEYNLEAYSERKTRVNGYFQRFEALYGQLRFSDKQGHEQDREAFVDTLLMAADNRDPQRKVDLPVAIIFLADLFRANLVIPLGLATVLSLIGWFLVVDPQISVPDYKVPDVLHIKSMSSPLNFAFLGAYFFGVQMLFRRFVRRDLSPNAFLAFATRIILAVVAVWVVVLCLPKNVSSDAVLVVAFTVGVFPRLLWKYITTFFAFIGRAKVFLPNIGSLQPLSQLDGLTIWHEVRLEEEDIENVPNMATVDIVDLMLRTQTPAERLILWIDQSILYCTLGPVHGDPNGSDTAAAKLRELGIRSATQFAANTLPGSVERTAVEKVLGGDSAPLPTLTCALALEPNFQLMRNWRGI